MTVTTQAQIRFRKDTTAVVEFAVVRPSGRRTTVFTFCEREAKRFGLVPMDGPWKQGRGYDRYFRYGPWTPVTIEVSR